MKRASRVARPISRTSNPVANGSSVPRWPTRRDASAPRTTATTSCEVKPAGLSTRRTPSGAGAALWIRLPLLDLGEQTLDARRASNTLVESKKDLGSGPKAKRLPKDRSKMAGETLQSLERRGALDIGAKNAHEYLRRSKIARHLDGGHRDEADDARILHALVEEARDFLAN